MGGIGRCPPHRQSRTFYQRSLSPCQLFNSFFCQHSVLWHLIGQLIQPLIQQVLLTRQFLSRLLFVDIWHRFWRSTWHSLRNQWKRLCLRWMKSTVGITKKIRLISIWRCESKRIWWRTGRAPLWWQPKSEVKEKLTRLSEQRHQLSGRGFGSYSKVTREQGNGSENEKL